MKDNHHLIKKNKKMLRHKAWYYSMLAMALIVMIVSVSVLPALVVARPLQNDGSSPSPTPAPTHTPSTTPTKAPTKPPTKAPTGSPTKPPTKTPTKAPTGSPTKAPTP